MNQTEILRLVASVCSAGPAGMPMQSPMRLKIKPAIDRKTIMLKFDLGQQTYVRKILTIERI